MDIHNEQGKNVLLSGIKRDAEHQSESILKEARAYAEARRSSAQKQAESTVRDAERKLESRKAAIRRSVTSSREQAVKRILLKSLDRVIGDVMNRVEGRLKGMIDGPSYHGVLLGWIVEAGVGLGTDAADIQTSLEERPKITKDLMTEAEEEIKKLTGRPTSLDLPGERPLSNQGVILYSRDGRKAYNNLVKTRIERFKTEIRNIIYSRVFGEDNGVHHG